MTGRTALLRALDEVLEEPEALENFKKMMRRQYWLSPPKFFRQYVMPLLPKGAKDRVPWSELGEDLD